MKRTFTVLVLISLASVSCTSQQGPKGVAKSYLNAVDKFDFKTAEQYLLLNEENIKSLENMKRFSEQMTTTEKEKYSDRKIHYEFKEEQINGNMAHVSVSNDAHEQVSVIKFEMQKLNGKWLIRKIHSN